MPCQVYFENHVVSNVEGLSKLSQLKDKICQEYGVPIEDLYVTINGKTTANLINLDNNENVVRFYARLVGGKGGFGSMLRAIGAQIEKTTNREACRDLSGRRLRDINEEKRLRKWLEGQEERDREAAERKQMKLERLMAEPKINVSLNASYEKEREELPERVSAAVDAGWQAAGTSDTGMKRKAVEAEKPVAKKKSKLWIDAELSDCSSLSDDDNDDVILSSKQTVSTDSGNETDKASCSSKS